jgi:hypothetical protein
MEKQPRLQPHQQTWQNARMTALAQLGIEAYHRPNPYIKEYEQKLGQLSLLDRPDESQA